MEANNTTNAGIENYYAPNAAMTEQLRSILARESGSIVSFDDAKEVGTQLISLYECLARKPDDNSPVTLDGQIE